MGWIWGLRLAGILEILDVLGFLEILEILEFLNYLEILDFLDFLRLTNKTERLDCQPLRKLLIQFVNHKTRAQFRLKPSGLWRHDVARVGNIHYLVHRYGIEGEG